MLLTPEVAMKVLSLAVLAVAVGVVGGASIEAKTYGKGVTLTETTLLADVIAKPSQFEGKTVKVEGYVTAVCQEMGCWMALSPVKDKSDQTLLIQVEHDGVITFPMSAKGSFVAAEGTVLRVGSKESLAAAREHAEQQGKSAADAGQWQIKATGATIP
jgi:RecJ-like exonuclease